MGVRAFVNTLLVATAFGLELPQRVRPAGAPKFSLTADRRRFLEAAALAALAGPSAAVGGFGQLQLSPTASQPAPFGAMMLPDARRYYTAESLLLSSLPVECPPLAVLQAELEKLYILRDDANLVDVLGKAGSEEQRRLAAARAAASSTYWSVLQEAQMEAVSAVAASRPLFRLFLSSATAKAGERRLDKLAEV